MDQTEFKKYTHNNPFMEHNHIEICSYDINKSRLCVKMVPESKNLRGFAHGGLLFTLADCSAGLVSRADGRHYVTQSSHINFLRTASDGTVFADASVIKRGRQLVIVHVDITDENGILLADAAVDMICTDNK